jgi:dihydroorotase
VTSISLVRPDDWHLHLRDGERLAAVVGHSAAHFGRAVVMPNLVPPVETVEQALAYRQRILAARGNTAFEPLMTLYLTERTQLAEVRRAAADPHVCAIKLYPAGATTHSEAGVKSLQSIYPVLELMAELALPLLVHGETTDPETDVFDREARFVGETLAPLVERFPRLKVVLEHITTREAVSFVRATREGVAATITAHHLLYNRNAMFRGGIRPDFYCLPILKREVHRRALLDAATSGNPRFFLGTDSAPHAASAKHAACGCAGIYTAHAALALYAQAFESVDAIGQLEAFASFFGPDFYGLPRNTQHVQLVREPWQVPATYDFGGERLTPLCAGETLAWRVVDSPRRAARA